MTNDEREFFILKTKTIVGLLKCIDENEFALTAQTIAEQMLTALGGGKISNPSERLREISAYIQRLDESGIKSTSIDEIALGCSFSYMTHPEKIHCARELQARRFQRRRRHGPAGQEWCYAKMPAYNPMAG